MRPEITAAVIDQAHKHHMKAFAHIHDYADAKLVMEQGIDMLAHEVRDREVDDSFIAMMKAKKVAITPTLVRELSSFVYADSPPWLDDPFLSRSLIRSESSSPRPNQGPAVEASRSCAEPPGS